MKIPFLSTVKSVSSVAVTCFPPIVACENADPTILIGMNCGDGPPKGTTTTLLCPKTADVCLKGIRLRSTTFLDTEKESIFDAD